MAAAVAGPPRSRKRHRPASRQTAAASLTQPQRAVAAAAAVERDLAPHELRRRLAVLEVMMLAPRQHQQQVAA